MINATIKGDFLIKIDHHPNDDAYGDLRLVDTASSSASEIIALFAFENRLEVNDYIAKLLYADDRSEERR